MVTLEFFGPGVTPILQARALWAVHETLNDRGVSLWHAACAMVEMQCIARLYDGGPTVPRIPEPLLRSLQAWLAIQPAVEEVCGKEAQFRVVGEPDPDELQMPWPPSPTFPTLTKRT